MNIRQVICDVCAGIGKYHNWKTVYTDDVSNTIEREEVDCETCNGKGYIEYATFTLEEAKAILKHCGLITET